MENMAEKFSNYKAFQFHFGDLVVEKVGKDDYIAHRPGTDTCVDWIQRGSKEYINGWMYGAVQRECGQIHKEPPEEAHVDQAGICPVCGAELEFEERIQIIVGGDTLWKYNVVVVEPR